MMEELKKKLESVSDCYDDFVRGMLLIAKEDPDKVDLICKYIDDHRDATTSDIIKAFDT